MEQTFTPNRKCTPASLKNVCKNDLKKQNHKNEILRLRLVHVKYFLERKIFSSVWLYYENFSRK